MDITTLELLIDRKRAGTPLNFGWGVFTLNCPLCLRETIHIAMIGTTGTWDCPCGYKQEMAWDGKPNMPHDGGWLDPIQWDKAKLIERN